MDACGIQSYDAIYNVVVAYGPGPPAIKQQQKNKKKINVTFLSITDIYYKLYVRMYGISCYG